MNPLKPPTADMARVVEADPPWWSIKEPGFAKKVKSPPGTLTKIVMFSTIPLPLAETPTS